MKETKKTLVNVAVMLLIFIAADYMFGKVASKLLVKMPVSNNEFSRMNYMAQSAKYDCVILGSSRGSHHYNPEIIRETLGMSCFNASRDGHGISYADGVLKMLCESGRTPKLVILECGQIELLPSWLGTAGHLTPYYADYKTLQEVINASVGENEKYACKSNFYKFNNTLLQIARNYISGEQKGVDGFVPLLMDDGFVEEKEIVHTKNDYKVDEVSLSILNDVVTTCQQHNIKLIACCSPVYGDYSSQSIVLNELFSRLKTTYLDYSQDDYFIKHYDYFKDKDHLKIDGANDYTKIIANKVKKYITHE